MIRKSPIRITLLAITVVFTSPKWISLEAGISLGLSTEHAIEAEGLGLDTTANVTQTLSTTPQTESGSVLNSDLLDQMALEEFPSLSRWLMTMGIDNEDAQDVLSQVALELLTLVRQN